MVACHLSLVAGYQSQATGYGSLASSQQREASGLNKQLAGKPANCRWRIFAGRKDKTEYDLNILDLFEITTTAQRFNAFL